MISKWPAAPSHPCQGLGGIYTRPSPSAPSPSVTVWRQRRGRGSEMSSSHLFCSGWPSSSWRQGQERGWRWRAGFNPRLSLVIQLLTLKGFFSLQYWNYYSKIRSNQINTFPTDQFLIRLTTINNPFMDQLMIIIIYARLWIKKKSYDDFSP